MNQQLRATVPKGLSQLSAATLTKQSAAGLSTPIAGLQLLTDSSTGLPYWSYHNSLPADNFTEANTQFTLQYTATVTEEWINQFLLFSSTVTGNDGGGTPITPITKEQSLPTKTVPSVLCRCQLQFPLKFTFSQQTNYILTIDHKRSFPHCRWSSCKNTMAFVGKRESAHAFNFYK